MESGAYHSYTFPVENLVDTTVVQNLMLSYKGDGVYDSYLVTYNNLTIEEKEQIALGNNVDLSGRVEVSLFEDQDWNEQRTLTCTNEITVTETTCSFIGQKPNSAHSGCFIDEESGEPLVIITINVSQVCNNTGGSGSSGGSSGGSGSSGSGGGGGGGGGTTGNDNSDPCANAPEITVDGVCATGVTLPIVFDIDPDVIAQTIQINKLNQQTAAPAVKQRIVELQSQVETSTTEQGSEFKLINGTLVDFPVPESDVGFDFTKFSTASNNTKLRVHLHHNTTIVNPETGSVTRLTPFFSFEDVLGGINTVIDIENTDASLDDALDFSSILVTRQGLLALRVTDPIKALDFVNTYLDETQTNEKGESYLDYVNSIYENIQKRFDVNCNNGNTSCTEEVENIFYLQYFLDFVNIIDAGITIFNSTTVDTNGNPIWQIAN